MSQAYPGDHVYFHKGDQPCCGKVLASGKHGCTVDHDGKPHKVKWQHVLGHKKRADQRYKVLDQGEDGLIVEDGTGRRRYVGIPPDARGEQLHLAKAFTPALPAGASVLLKSGAAGTIIGRPGRDGAHVRDESGAVHKVRWVEMTPA